MRKYFITITICVSIGNIIPCIFNADPTAITALLIACCALYKHYDKEE